MPQIHYGDVLDFSVDGASQALVRGRVYRILAFLLSFPPSDDDLADAARLTGDGTPVGAAFASTGRIAALMSSAQVAMEYDALFRGLGPDKAQLVPFSSFYRGTPGAETPLDILRCDMARLGVARDPAISDPEDHVASILEIMAGLADGSLGEDCCDDAERSFFNTHIASWMPRFFADMTAARSSLFYASLGAAGSAFLSAERQRFKLG